MRTSDEKDNDEFHPFINIINAPFVNVDICISFDNNIF
jgi:hypothetical protein